MFFFTFELFESKRKETFQILYKFLDTFALFLTQGVWRQKIKKWNRCLCATTGATFRIQKLEEKK